MAAALFNRSLLAQHVARSLQVAIDLDRDGFSAVFNGGDCNDRNARISPRAHDIPDNGVDENCSGRDARVEPAESTGFLAPMGPEIALRPPSFVLLSVDAMRPDHMGCYGYRRPTTPNMDRFARGAARFTNARCTSPRSLRSFASIFTGRYASNVSWGNDVQFPPLAEDNITLAEQLRDAGYLTATFMDTGYFVHTPGFFQGFTEIHQTLEFRSDVAPTIAQLQEFLRTHANDAQPFFVWVHLMEAHDPYEDRTTPREFGHAPVDQYDEAIAHADHALGPVLEQLDAMSETRPLVTVVFADHGEAFGEHGVFHHSFDLHDEALRVPMLVRGPGITPGPRHALAALFDLLPTLLNFAGRAPAVPVAGRSLVPALLAPAAAPPRGWRDHLYAEVTPDGVFLRAEVPSMPRRTRSSMTCAAAPGSCSTSPATRANSPTSTTTAPTSPLRCASACSPGPTPPPSPTDRAPSSSRRACASSRRCSTLCTSPSATSSSCSATTCPTSASRSATSTARPSTTGCCAARGCPSGSTSTSSRCLARSPSGRTSARGTCPSTAATSPPSGTRARSSATT
ncbi:MAG: sulfatase-like hydrolase/transferase [Deltaproteobacteria bacterium]|nr:sulfatase-like hydrolase/transferase [Deltaproteobacteria bacterium]